MALIDPVIVDDSNVSKTNLRAYLKRAVLSDGTTDARIFSGVIRNDGSGWDYIADSEHRRNGFDAVTVTSGKIHVTYNDPVTKVGTLLVGPDEQFASRGITAGASVGTDEAIISVYMPLSCWLEKSAGAWVFQDIDTAHDAGTDTTVATTSGESTCTITHGDSLDTDVPLVTILKGGGGSVPGVDVRVSYGTDTTVIEAVEDLNGYIVYNGSAWVVTTNNIDVPTVNYTAGVLTVTHEALGSDTKGLNITQTGGVHVVHGGGTLTSTTFQVVFYDYTGTLVTTADTNMKFRYHRPRQVKTKAPDGMRIAVRRNAVLIDAAKLEAAFGNFWLIGEGVPTV